MNSASWRRVGFTLLADLLGEQPMMSVNAGAVAIPFAPVVRASIPSTAPETPPDRTVHEPTRIRIRRRRRSRA